jgi:endonuclease G, mitochondrial
MNDDVPAALTRIVEQRLQNARTEIRNSLTFIANGNPLAAEPDNRRRVRRLQSKASLTRGEAELVSMGIDAVTESPEPVPMIAGVAKDGGPEAIIGSIDFVGVAFLERGRRAADSVARVAFGNGNAKGTGFLVAPGLFLTNHHVIASPAEASQLCVEFDYEFDIGNNLRVRTRYAFDPARCFTTDGIAGLDFTLIALGERLDGPRNADVYGYIPLSDANDKHMLGEIANIIQHPRGRYKEIVLRENRLVARDETVQVLHYIADTEPGSSGSPVFNNDWEVIALHHWGGPYREVKTPDGRPLNREINEGIRISAIVKTLRERAAAGAGATQQALRRALGLWRSFARPTPVDVRTERNDPVPPASGPRRNADGSVTWTFPIEINVRAPLLEEAPSTAVAGPAASAAAAAPLRPPPPSDSAEATTWKTEDFSDRGGYEPGFIPGFTVPLPGIRRVRHRAAVNKDAGPGDDPHELPYHHFSIVMNAERRLAFFTACNIDGKRIRAVIRDKKQVIEDPTLKDLGVEALEIGAEGAEASDDFRPDRRIDQDEQMNRPFYEAQIVPGFPEPTSKERIARMFQKGHITLRGDPAWGTEGQAKAAERDTFFYTNAAPQVGFFNQGSRLDRPGSKGKLRWRAVETYVLRNAVTMRSRITVFAGPIFDDDKDPDYRFDSKVPMRFWKIAVWADGDELRAIALIADQSKVLTVMPEAAEAAEAFLDDPELARVSEFLTTVQNIERLTGLNFGDAVRDADVRAGEGADLSPALDLEPEKLRGGRRRSPKRPTRPGGARSSRRTRPGRR